MTRDPNAMLTLKDVARRLNVSLKTIYGLVHHGTLEATRIGKAYRVEPGEVDRCKSRLRMAQRPVAPTNLRGTARAMATDLSHLPGYDFFDRARARRKAS